MQSSTVRLLNNRLCNSYRLVRKPVPIRYSSIRSDVKSNSASVRRGLHSGGNSESAPSGNKTSPFYVTTPIFYVNGAPHLGHAYTTVLADTIARFHREDGRDVLFLTGTDEHGQKVQQSATTLGIPPQKYADDMSMKFRHLAEKLQCSHDDFLRTTERRHRQTVEAMWRTLERNGHLYLGKYQGWYSVADEAFYAPDEITDGKAPSGAEVTWVEEESYFFKLSAFTDKLLALYETSPDSIAPKSRRNEVLGFLRQPGGLKDLSVSRTSFSWGVPVPGNPKHVVYVWLDALVNYLSALGYKDAGNSCGDSNSGLASNRNDAVSTSNDDGGKSSITGYSSSTENTDGSSHLLIEKGSAVSRTMQQYWPASVHIIGKDILRFHAIYWPAFLMAAGLEPPQVRSTYTDSTKTIFVIIGVGMPRTYS